MWCKFLITWYVAGAGISIIENTKESGIVMELEMNWDANPSIILAVKTRLGVALPIQVRYFTAMPWSFNINATI